MLSEQELDLVMQTVRSQVGATLLDLAERLGVDISVRVMRGDLGKSLTLFGPPIKGRKVEVARWPA